LDFTTLEPVKNQFLTARQQKRESDLIWRIQFRGQWLYVYLLLEFQSRVDPFMAVRIMSYVGLLYQDLARQSPWSKRKCLPPVLPIVLYNGRPRWQAKREVAELIVDSIPESLQKYIPRARYFLLDAGAIDESESYRLKNLAAAVFRLEHSHSAEDILTVMRHLLEWLTDPEQESLKQSLAIWLTEIPLKRLAPGHRIKPASTLQEAHTMLAETIDSWTRQWKKEGLEAGRKEGWEQGRQEGRLEGRQEGRLEGRQEGRQEGRLEGELLILQRQLIKRFGPLPAWAETKLRQASSEQLERWGEQLLDAESLELALEERS